MRGRSSVTAALTAIVVAAVLMGCGDGGNDTAGFKNCGNGVLDGGEECDDGNLVDEDACLSTCRFNVCGDAFLNTGVEQCDAGSFGGATCVSLGFAAGTLACTPQCTLDASACNGTVPSTPNPTTTPGSGPTTPNGGATSTAPGGTAVPTVVATPGGPACQAGDQIIVTESVDKTYGAVRIDLTYPASVNIPGTGTADSVSERIHFENVGGITTVNDDDQDADGVDETLTASTLGTTDLPAGIFVTITFDCVAGAPRPVTSDFDCAVVSASTGGGVQIPDLGCTVSTR